MEDTYTGTMDKLLIIINPISGRGRGAQSIIPIENYLRDRNTPFSLHVTTQPGDAEEVAKRSVQQGYTQVVAAGGDGTIHEVVSGLMKSRYLGDLPDFGVLTVGRGNDFAFGAGVLTSVEEELEAVIQGKTMKIDIGTYSLNGGPLRYFANGVGVGIEPLINKAATASKCKGTASYVDGAMRVLCDLPKPYDLLIRADREEFSVQSQQLSVGNGTRMGGMFIMTPLSNLTDGLLDLAFANRPVRGWEVPKLAYKFFRGKQIGDPRLHYSQHKEIEIEARGSSRFVCHADGEHLTDEGKTLKISIIHHAIGLIVKDSV